MNHEEARRPRDASMIVKRKREWALCLLVLNGVVARAFAWTSLSGSGSGSGPDVLRRSIGEKRVSTDSSYGIPCFRRPALWASKLPEEPVNFDDLWMDDEDLDGFILDGPDAYLNDDDMSLLHDIAIPGLKSSITNSENVSAAPMLSLQDLNQLSYFYLRNELGLPEDAMWKITNEAGSVLGMKATTIRNKVDVLRRTMNLSDEDIRTLIPAQPSLLHLSAKKNLSPTILFLVRQLDMGTSELRSLVMGCPALLCYSISNLQQKILFFRETMEFSVDQTRVLLLKEPRLMTSSAETGLLPRFQFLHKELEASVEDLQKIVQKNPSILKMSVDGNLQPKLIFYFVMTLSMTPPEVVKLLKNFPNILDYSLDEHNLPITRYFLSLDISAREFARMLLKFPRLLTNSLIKIKHVVGYLRYELGLEANGVRRVLYQAPQVVSLTTENLESKVAFFLQAAAPGATRGHTSSTRILRKLIVGMPTLLYLSLDKNLGPKVEYLQETLGREEFSLAIERLPTLLGYSLEKRIKPRLEKILNTRVDGGSLTVGIPMKEEAFDAWLQGRARKAELGITRVRPRKLKPKEVNAGAPKETESSTSSAKVDEKSNTRVVQEGGRIVHWVRRP